MDNPKDNEIKDRDRPLSVKDRIESVSFVLLKAQKLTAALYLVSDFLSDNEPLKYRLREKALDLLILCITGHHERSLVLLKQTSALLDVVLTRPMVSKMNFSVLKQEYTNLADAILRTQNVTPYLERPDLYPRPFGSEPRKMAVGGTSPVSSRLSVPIPPPLTGQRREAILKFIKQTGWSSGPEIAKAVPHLGSKTVQRELAALVREGFLRKEGNRRWSRYSAV